MSEVFIGDTTLTRKAVAAVTLSKAIAVIVSGSQPCGHMLLNADSREGWYLHVTELVNRPRFMGLQGYERYLKESGYQEITRIPLQLSRPDKARLELYRLLYLEWPWLPLPDWNCVAFVHRIVNAGGASIYASCPRR